ncbi:MAG: tetratricopeptide repeat protein [Fibrobacteraceae bacterium]|nr:tetratricopeptide repeat protein [Fibrobacteraceae bacterium]
MKTILSIPLCAAAIAFAIQTADDLSARAAVLYKQGRYGEAVLLFRKAESRGADPFTTSFNTANCLFQQEKYPEAAAAYEKAIAASKGKSDVALFNYASVLFRLGEYAESVAAYNRALSMDPDNGSAWLYLGEAYSKIGDNVGTLRALTTAYELSQNDISIAYQLAEAYIALNDIPSAISLIRKAYEKNPEESDFLVYIGDVYRLDKKYSESAGAYREALSVNPDNTSVMYKLADVLSEAGENYIAMDELSKILQIDPKFSDAAIFLGNLAFDAKWWDRAEQAYTKAATAHNTEAIYGFKNLSFEANKDGDREEAIRYLQTAQKYFPSEASLEADIIRLKSF